MFILACWIIPAGFSQEVPSDELSDQVLCRMLADIPPDELNENEREGLLYILEEEMMARDLYAHFATIYDIPVFSNISSRGETHHVRAVQMLIDRYQLADSTGDCTQGSYFNTVIQKEYNRLKESGSRSLADALMAGAEIEEMDISDLQNLKGNTDNQDILMVLNNLGQASRHHLRIFVRHIEARGMTYTPRHISQSEFMQIIGVVPDMKD